MNEALDQRISAARARMAELAAKFVERTRADLRTMRGDLVKLGAGDVGALAQMRHLAHRMAGTGATLGFAALGDLAAALESRIDTLPAGASPDARLLERLEADICALEAQLESDAQRHHPA